MFRSGNLEVWNLSPNAVVQANAQDVFNIVGRIHDPEQLASFSYSLNGGPETPVFFRRGIEYDGGRLSQQGDFNIDTIKSAKLERENLLTVRLRRAGKEEERHILQFRCAAHMPSAAPGFRLDLGGVRGAEEVGQVVDGKWLLGRDEEGRSCLEIREEDAGYDRIILFGRSEWPSGYEVCARLAPTSWTGPHHNVGLLFKWNTHRTGDGTHLPTRWSTGLGYYCSYTAGLRLRFGTDVHIDASGRKAGDHVLQERPYSLLRRWGYRLFNDLAPLRLPLSQLPAGRHYWFRLRVDPERYALTVWAAGRSEPRPQLAVPHPVEYLSHGSVGVIALCCAVRVYEYVVTPL